MGQKFYSSDTFVGAAGKLKEFGKRASAAISGFPPKLEERMKKSPYSTAGIALGVGVGVGVLLGSRILRAVVTSAVSFVVVEMGRAYLSDRTDQKDDANVNGGERSTQSSRQAAVS